MRLFAQQARGRARCCRGAYGERNIFVAGSTLVEPYWLPDQRLSSPGVWGSRSNVPYHGVLKSPVIFKATCSRRTVTLGRSGDFVHLTKSSPATPAPATSARLP